QYGRERLIERNEHDAIAVRHATTYAALAERLDRGYETTPDATWFAECETEQENWRAALSWSLAERHDVVLGQRLVAALRWAWSALAAAEGRRWVALASEAVDEKTPLQVLGALRLAEAVLAVALAQHTAALAAAERARAAFEALDELRGLAEALV